MEKSKQICREAYWYWLCNAGNLYRGGQARLLHFFGTPERAFRGTRAELLRSGLREEEIQEILRQRRNWNLFWEYQQAERLGVHFYSCEHSEYPARLKNLTDYPFGIYVKGKLPDPKRTAIALIGARRCSGYGQEAAREFGSVLGAQGLQVISGLAAGVDGLSQQGCLAAGGYSLGVLGSGVDVCYPRENSRLYQQLGNQGGLLSEQPLGAQPVAFHFPMRNRLIAALADAVVVIEAKKKSGTLITVECALNLGRDVFAVPGRRSDPLSEGCNHLISQGAGLISDPWKLLLELNINCEKKEKNMKKINLRLAREENLVYSCLDFNPKSLSEILVETKLTVPEVSKALLSLEMQGYIRECVKNCYQIKHK